MTNAPVWKRVVATLIDMLLVPTLTLVLIIVTGTVEHAEDYQDSMWILEVLILAVASYIILNGATLLKRGQTIGKMALGIRLANADNDAIPPLWKLICLRAPFFPLNYLVPAVPLTILPLIDHAFAFRKDRRCVHDLAAGTRVVAVAD